LEQRSRTQTQEPYTVRQSAGLVVCQSAGLVVCRFAGLVVCRFAGLVVCQFAGLVVCQSAGLVVCQSAGLVVCQSAGLVVCRFAGLPVRRMGLGPSEFASWPAHQFSGRTEERTDRGRFGKDSITKPRGAKHYRLRVCTL
jgi:hypothetical protein